LGQLAGRHLDVNVIVCSNSDKDVMSKCISNNIVVIPQQHCNFDREVRTRKEVKNIGVIGTRDAFPMIPKELKDGIRKQGFELIEFCKFFTRQDIIDFYKQIDIQLVWRPYKKLLSNPLKIVNASSFGIPTIALDEPTFKEVEGCYVPVANIEGFLEALQRLVDSENEYFSISKHCLLHSEDYHIEKIGQLYKNLDQ
jgi:glycosyltransferase involved in cell wall biosynthesis